MKRILKKCLNLALGVITAVFAFVPERVFGIVSWFSAESSPDNASIINGINILISRAIAFLIIWLLTIAAYAAFQKCRRFVEIKGNNYTIRVEYGDLLKTKNCKKVISFDECYSTSIGDRPGEIKRTSICGQYLTMHPNINLKKLIADSELKPLPSKSKYKQQLRYQPGTIVQNGDDLLMAFSTLDASGRAIFFSRDEYLNCLNKLWKEIDKHYAQKDVCIPLLGAGLTRFDSAAGASYSAQELLDIIILSYKLSSNKIKTPYKLRIVCKKSDDLSLNRITL